MTFKDINETLKHVYSRRHFDVAAQQTAPFGRFISSLNVGETQSTILLLAQEAVEKLKPSPRCRWKRDAEGRIQMDQKPAKYMGDAPELSGVWVHYESARGGNGRELIRLYVVEEQGEFVLRARRW